MKNIVFQKKLSIKSSFGGMEITIIFLYLFIIIFVIFPLFTYIYEKMYFSIIENEIRNTLEVSLTSLYKEYNIKNLSKGNLKIKNDKDELEQYIKLNLNLKDDMSSKENSILFGDINIVDIEYGLKNVNIVLDIRIEPFIYRKVLMKMIDKSELVVRINVKVDMPINN
ncbi:hypothetical protein [Helicovermis profundi]|uniref:Uncharacterized protein n=1 Tax=Helicovermis profundi TaxID=3065157 RepID=A0AAU9EZ76_9FIRM|nr:hypothetical protein HLPR_27560 [Clostridia bacterium S502]